MEFNSGFKGLTVDLPNPVSRFLHDSQP